MKISVIVPVFNEEKYIKNVLLRLISSTKKSKVEIIIVNDGSTDNTVHEVEKVIKKNELVKLISHSKNEGKGEALKTGIACSKGDYILIQDADCEYSPEEIPKLISSINKNAVYGSRFIYKHVKIPFLYFLGNKFLTHIVNFLYGIHLTDMETGYKLIPGAFFRKDPLKSKGFDIEPEITIRLVKLNIPIYEVPITYKGRSHAAGKKLTVKDALHALWVILKGKISS